MFLLTFFIGMFGFVSMVALGALRGHGGGHGHGAAHAAHSGHSGHTSHTVGQARAHAASGAHAHGTGNSRYGHPNQARSASDGTPSSGARFLTALSPISIFSLSLGFGATGLLLNHVVKYPEIVILAFIGALVFSLGMVQPLMDFMGRFVTTPSEGIEGSVYQEAEAVTGFDEAGRGIVRLTLDGQHVQLLATLDLIELEKGIHVKKGEKLIVVEVDSARNTCRVTRELAS